MSSDPGATFKELSQSFSICPASAAPRRGLAKEQRWRCTEGLAAKNSDQTIIASRWLDCRESSREEEAGSSDGRYVVSLALKPTRITLKRRSAVVFEGLMPAGMLHLSIPGERLKARFESQCDFIHFYLSQSYFQECHELADVGRDCGSAARQDVLVRDILAEQLGRTLVDGEIAGNEAYAESVGRTIVMRLLGVGQSSSRVSALSKWRLKRVQEYVSSHIEEKISLLDLAGAAGLSRMHFAAQFKAATGFSPHDYVQHHRIEYAKETMTISSLPLAQVALCVGFQTQAHFTTVFKKLTGETPARWREVKLDRAWRSRAVLPGHERSQILR